MYDNKSLLICIQFIYRILKNNIKKPKWWEPDKKVRFVNVLKTYKKEYMPDEYFEILSLIYKDHNHKEHKEGRREGSILPYIAEETKV
jgi:hypothetical protein